jgi:hypothetical protein
LNASLEQQQATKFKQNKSFKEDDKISRVNDSNWDFSGLLSISESFTHENKNEKKIEIIESNKHSIDNANYSMPNPNNKLINLQSKYKEKDHIIEVTENNTSFGSNKNLDKNKKETKENEKINDDLKAYQDMFDEFYND